MQNTWEREGGEEMQRVSFSETRFKGRKGTFYPSAFRAVQTRLQQCPSQCFRNQCRPLRKTAGTIVSHQAAGQQP
jgi:hypothetical protein